MGVAVVVRKILRCGDVPRAHLGPEPVRLGLTIAQPEHPHLAYGTTAIQRSYNGHIPDI